VSDLAFEIGLLSVESYNQSEIFQHLQQRNPLYIPVPLSRERFKKRGYNHASLLCSYVAQYYQKEYTEKIISRILNTKPQYRLSRSQRSLNVKKAFVINENAGRQVKGKTIIVVDDVATTCSTLREIARVLKRNGAKEVWGVVFAREDKADFRR
jgi:ComF family protein